jgi:hypothetical protein
MGMIETIQPGPMAHDAGEKIEPLAEDCRSRTLLAAHSGADSWTVSRTDSYRKGQHLKRLLPFLYPHDSPMSSKFREFAKTLYP